MEKIPMEDLEERVLYRIRSRNLVVGIWVPEERGFIGVRNKFGDDYLFTEYHRDADPRYGTVSLMESTGIRLPDEIDVWEMKSECRTCNQAAAYTKERGWYHVSPPRPGGDHEVDAWWVTNRPLFDWMKPHSDEERNRWTR